MISLSIYALVIAQRRSRRGKHKPPPNVIQQTWWQWLRAISEQGSRCGPATTLLSLMPRARDHPSTCVLCNIYRLPSRRQAFICAAFCFNEADGNVLRVYSFEENTLRCYGINFRNSASLRYWHGVVKFLEKLAFMEARLNKAFSKLHHTYLSISKQL